MSIKPAAAQSDFVTRVEGKLGITEAKTGGARLSTGQKQLQSDIEAGRDVTPVGKNAENAGLKPGQPVTIDSHNVARQNVAKTAGEAP